jgi:hypothetical protein
VTSEFGRLVRRAAHGPRFRERRAGIHGCTFDHLHISSDFATVFTGMGEEKVDLQSADRT